jgi:P-type Ca2+ transporter type 2C
MGKKDNVVVSDEKSSRVFYETRSIEDTVSELKTDPKKGLTSEEAKARIEKYGPNKLKESKKKTWIQIFFEQMKNPMIYILFAAIAITIAISIYDTISVANNGWVDSNGVAVLNPFLDVGDWPDVIIILAVIILNSVIGTVQEIKAQSSLDALKQMSSPESTVVRDGKRFKIKSSELVPGDIVILEEGDTIGADLRLIESINLKANESSLTGESVPVEKNAEALFKDKMGAGDRTNCAYMSTPVTYGRGTGIVISTGMDTEIGKIATALDSEEDSETPLQKNLAQLSKSLGILTIIIVVAVLIVDIIWIFVNGTNTVIDAWIDAILAAIALAVAAVPEGLAAIVTIVLSIGVQRMVKAKTIVRKLPSVETLGAVSVVCSDKTGTLTQNKMTVLEAYCDDSFYKAKDFVINSTHQDLKTLAKGMSLCSNATVDEGLYGDPTEIALVVFANAFNMHKKDLEEETPRIDELPFDSVRKMMSTMHKETVKNVVYTKGALDSILARTDRILDKGIIRKITDEDIKKINEANLTFSDKALRVLALAMDYKDKIVEEKLVFVGLVAMIDPPRLEAKPAVATFKKAGITTIMITGDHKDTAFAIAKELGIAEKKTQCMFGAELDTMTPEQIQEAVKTVRVFARVSPENKVSIVKALIKNGNIVAMTGDGVNDAPSLKAADIGIAMGITGTDVAKGAADMVLTDDNFASIEKAVEEGRAIYANIKKTVIFLLSSNISEVLVMFFIICVGFPTPFIAIHLLWINLITDSLPAIALGMDPKEPGIMDDKPRKANESLFARGGLKNTILYGAIITVSVILAYLSNAWMNGQFTYSAINTFYSDASNLHLAQTMAFTALAFSELLNMLCMSNTERSFVHIFKSRNWMMLIAMALGVALQLFVIETPGVSDVFSTANMDWQHWLITLACAFAPLVYHEIYVFVKWIVKKFKKAK